MRPISNLFFLTGAIFALCGMIWGIQMSASHDHGLSPAHGHLNLIGFVSMCVFGAYYALSPTAAQSRLAGVHYLLATASVLILVPGIVLAIQGQTDIVAKLGSVLAVASMVVFVFTVLRNGSGVSAARQAHPAE